MSTKLVASPKSGAFWRERRKEQQRCVRRRRLEQAAGSSSTAAAFHLPKLALGRVCVDGADGGGDGRQWTRSGPPLPPRPACCAVCLRRHCLAAASPPVCSRRRRRTMYSARRQAIVCCWLTCQPLPSLALKHRTMVGIFGSRYDTCWFLILISLVSILYAWNWVNLLWFTSVLGILCLSFM